MRCVDCQNETHSPLRHCVCCGRDLVSAAAPVSDTKLAVPLCAVCGGPSPEGECCTNCLNSFSDWAGTEPVAAPALEPLAPPPVEKKDVIDALWSELMNTPPPPQSEWVDPAASANPVAPTPPVPAPPAPPVPPVPPAPALTLEPVQKPTALQIPPPPSPPTLLPATPVPVPRSAKIEGGTDGVHLEAARTEPVKKTAKPAPVANDWKPKSAPKPPKPMNQLLLPMAALVVVAVGLGGYWVRTHGGLVAVLEGETADAGIKPAPQPASRPAEPAKKAAAERTAKPEPQQAPKPRTAQPKPAARQAAAASPRPRPATTRAPEPIPAAPVASRAVMIVAPEPPNAAAAPAPTSFAPQGPFFEPTDVHESPRVASKVSPDVPAELRAQARNEIVIVRMLISQIGRPSRVSLLRKSKSGARVDDAVIAAVSQWTFSPARRRGEAVSSWFNIGVPVMAN